MTIPVKISDFDDHILYFTQKGGSAILLGANEERQCRIWTCDPYMEDGLVIIPNVGSSQLRLIASNPVATLVYPAIDPHGFTFIIDGHAEVLADEPNTVALKPSGGMLHRPPTHADGPEWTGV